MLIQRQEYIERLRRYRDNGLIKIITGIRHCGKTTLLKMYQDELRQLGVLEEQIVSVDLDKMVNYELTGANRLDEFLKSRLVYGKKSYIFIDEVQNCANFQQAVDGVFLEGDVDIYLTCSNAYSLSGEIAKKLTGQYIEIQMMPLSFREYMSTRQSCDKLEEYNRYIVESSFPYPLQMNGEWRDVKHCIEGIYSTIMLKDIVFRGIINDYPLLDVVAKCLAESAGILTSAAAITKALSGGSVTISSHTMRKYIDALKDSYILHQVGRYDIRAQRFIRTSDKHYLGDVALRQIILDERNENSDEILQNIIFLELLRRGNQVYVGKIGGKTVNFVVQTMAGGIEYYQVLLSVNDKDRYKNKLSPLKAIKDGNRRYILSLDGKNRQYVSGVESLNALDWLMGTAITDDRDRQD